LEIVLFIIRGGEKLQGCEPLIKELLTLASMKPLSKENLARAKQIMIELRKNGFTSRDLSELTDGAWSEPTIKSYTSGTSVEDSAQKKDSMNVLRELLTRDLTIDHVSSFLSANSKLKADGVTLEEISSLHAQMTALEMDVEDLVEMHNGLAESDLSFADLRESLPYR